MSQRRTVPVTVGKAPSIKQSAGPKKSKSVQFSTTPPPSTRVNSAKRTPESPVRPPSAVTTLKADPAEKIPEPSRISRSSSFALTDNSDADVAHKNVLPLALDVQRTDGGVPTERLTSRLSTPTTSPAIKPVREPLPLRAMEDMSQFIPENPSPHLKLSKQQRVSVAMVDAAQYPRSYREQSRAELTLFEYVENFRRQFEQLYRARSKLTLTPRNEVAVDKFVCTTLRPCQLRFDALYDYAGCATFVANYLKYEPLEPPTRMPDTVPSPSTVLTWQAGDCVDYAMLLTSLLLGVGYDAYVVCGYATKIVTLCDRTLDACPTLVKEQRLQEERVAEKLKQQEAKSNVFATRKRPNMQSQFLAAQAEKKQRQLDDEWKEEKKRRDDRERADEAAYKEDALHGKRVHCWVLVRQTKRGELESFFLEPTTGEKVPVTSDQYLGVDCLWNDRNYWVNMQSAADGNGPLSFDALDDPLRWEKMFPSDESDELTHSDSAPQFTTAALMGKKKAFEMPTSWVEELQLSRIAYERQYPDRRKAIVYKNCVVELFAQYSRYDGMVESISMFSEALPRGQPEEVRQTFFMRGDCMEKRILKYNARAVLSTLKHTSLYEDMPNVEQAVEIFKPGRPTGLSQLTLTGTGVCALISTSRRGPRGRLVAPKGCRVVEFDMKFDPNGRSTHDRLVYRNIVVNKQMEQQYSVSNAPLIEDANDSADRLVHRSVYFDETNEPGSSLNLLAGVAPEHITATVLPRYGWASMCERFQHPGRDCLDDVATRRFLTKLNTIEEECHLMTGQIRSTSFTYRITESHTYTKSMANAPPDVIPDAFWCQESNTDNTQEHDVEVGQRDRKDLFLRFLEAANAELRCETDLLNGSHEALEEIQRREIEREKCHLIHTAYDTQYWRSVKPGRKEQEHLDEQAARFAAEDDATLASIDVPTGAEWITHFIEAYRKTHLKGVAWAAVTPAQAVDIKNSTLTYRKDRLMEKAATIRRKLDEAIRQINELQEEMARNGDHVQHHEMNNYQMDMYKREQRIKVLLERQATLHDNFLSDFRQTDAALWAHPLLKNLLGRTDGSQRR